MTDCTFFVLHCVSVIHMLNYSRMAHWVLHAVNHLIQTNPYLHSVSQGPWNGVKHIGCAHEQHLAEVHGHIQVVIQEARILLRVKQLKKSTGWVTLIPYSRRMAPEVFGLCQGCV